MNRRHQITGFLVGLSTVLALAGTPTSVAASTVGSTVASTSATCTDGHWPVSVQGRPTLFRAGARAGDYIWHDSTGWHLRVTHSGTGRVVFTGVIVASAPLDATPVKLERSDVVTVGADRRTITYRLVNYGGIDGFDFKTSCAARITFSGRMAGVLLPTSRIWIGRYDRHPLENPFTVRRVA
ncbi:MAG TPA: hypothetical protein VIR16_02910 [Candidatus Limnocylindrales bacterium]